MTISVEERLARAANVLDEHIEQYVVGVSYLAEGATPRRHRMKAGIVAAVAAVTLVLGVLLSSRGGGDGIVVAPTPASRPAGDEGWDLLPEAPVSARFQHLSVSTGSGLLVWGGYGSDKARTDGAFYDGETGTWRDVPKAPLAGDRGDAVGVWTGAEVIVINGIDGHVKAAAFDPESLSWRSLPDPPLTNAANMMTRVAAVGDAVVVIAVSVEGEGGARSEVARLDTTTDTWTIGQSPPASFGSGFDAVAVGSDIVVIGRRGISGASCGESTVLAYRPGANNWRNLPSGPIANRGGLAVASSGREVVVAGGIVCGDDSPRAETFLLDPVTESWRSAAPAPTAVRGSYRYGEAWTGRWMVAANDDGAPLLYDPAANRWHVGPPNPLRGRYTETAWTWVAGRVIIFSGGLADDEGGCCEPVDGGYAYTPPRDW
ncbi:MAG: hypothetical protein M3P85_01555 [Actinomycetota bacterium]|nr:hypothetical protein [Actinomycetota bacterium]